jgi:hypothetical protein
MLLLLPCLAWWACGNQGYPDLGQRLDVVVPIGDEDASTWLRATSTGTELLIIGSVDDQGEVGTTVVKIAPTTETELVTGTLILDDNDEGVFLQQYRYLYPYEPERTILSREGSHREESKPALEQDIALTYDGERLTVTDGDESYEFFRLEDVIARQDPTTREGATNLARVYNLAILTSQARLLGFGSAGMTQYLDETVSYRGLLSGHFTVHVEEVLSPKTDIIFHQCQDLSAVVLDGLQHTSADLNAKGRMGGQVGFTLHRSPDGDGPLWQGLVDYGEVLVDNGYAAGGYYVVTFGSEEWEVPYDVFSNMDLTALTKGL